MGCQLVQNSSCSQLLKHLLSDTVAIFYPVMLHGGTEGLSTSGVMVWNKWSTLVPESHDCHLQLGGLWWNEKPGSHYFLSHTTSTMEEKSSGVLSNVTSPVFIIDLIPKARSVDHRQLHSHPFLLNIWTEKKLCEMWRNTDTCVHRRRWSNKWKQHAAANRDWWTWSRWFWGSSPPGRVGPTCGSPWTWTGCSSVWTSQDHSDLMTTDISSITSSLLHHQCLCHTHTHRQLHVCI